MSCDHALDKLSEELNSRVLVQEGTRCSKGGTMCILDFGAPKKPGAGRVKENIMQILLRLANRQFHRIIIDNKIMEMIFFCR